MLLERFHDDSLAQVSYLLGCTDSGESLVVDPLREVEPYLDAAAAHGLRVTHVTETHIHADFVSGARELARRAGARLLLSGEGGPEWSYRYAEEEATTLLRGGDSFAVGSIRVQVLHTPGHTPEHLTFLVTDAAVADRPMGAFTGDFLFVADVGRPDLLERAAGSDGAADRGARQLFRSLRDFKREDDWLQIWPGHGAGSACGKGLGSIPSTTLGYERRFNPALVLEDEEAFVESVLAGQPEVPRYFAAMKRMNRDGPRVLGGPLDPPLLDPGVLREILPAGVVVDTRPSRAFAGGHVPGTLGIPLDGSFTANAGRLLPYDRELALIVDDPEEGRRAARALAAIGLDGVRGLLDASAVAEWARRDGRLRILSRTTAAELRDRRDVTALLIVDVRGRAESARFRIPGSIHVPLDELPEELGRLPTDRPLVLVCASGARSAVAASYLVHLGWDGVANLEGGLAAWIRGGHPVERGPPPAPPTLRPQEAR